MQETDESDSLRRQAILGGCGVTGQTVPGVRDASKKNVTPVGSGWPCVTKALP